jgi:hypothetical protein
MIVKPQNSRSFYYNYKGRFSIVLCAIANAKYEFIMVHSGTNGKVSDGGILHTIGFYEKLQSISFNLPAASTPMGINYSLPYTFVGDEAFMLMENLMKPYADQGLTEENIFNYRLSRARRIIENAFGILSSRFRVFRTEISLDVDHVDAVVLASCVLHNYLTRNGKAYLTPSSVDLEDINEGTIIPGEWRQESEALDVCRKSLQKIILTKPNTSEICLRIFIIKRVESLFKSAWH